MVLLGVGSAAAMRFLLRLSQSQTVYTDIELRLGVVMKILLFLIIAGAIPFLEEVIFRRIIFDWASAAMPVWLPAVLPTILFTLDHVVPAVMAYILFLGTSLILARLWLRSLWAPFLIHAASNGLVIIVALRTLGL